MSASALSREFAIPRQKIGYHLRKLEAGLIAASRRRRRGFTERFLATRSDALLVDPMILASADPQAVETQDRFAAEHLVRTAACMARDVPRMREVAVAENKPLLTFTLEADVSFAAPSDIDRFTFRLAKALADIAGEFTPVENGRTYRVTIAGHPAAATRGQTPGLN